MAGVAGRHDAGGEKGGWEQAVRGRERQWHCKATEEAGAGRWRCAVPGTEKVLGILHASLTPLLVVAKLGDFVWLFTEAECSRDVNSCLEEALLQDVTKPSEIGVALRHSSVSRKSRWKKCISNQLCGKIGAPCSPRVYAQSPHSSKYQSKVPHSRPA